MSKTYNNGDRIGPHKIELIERTFVDKHRKWHGKFKCPKCGSVFETIISNVAKGNTSSCGCIRDKNFYKKIHEHNYVDLKNKRSGDWVFLYRTDRQSKNKTWYWYCECENGHSNEILSSNFGKTTICRKCHPNSKGEQKIKNILKNNQIKYIEQYQFTDCKNVNKLSFDFYLPSYNCCIEYDGIQHFEKTKFSHDSFEERQKRDKIKNDYCKNHNIKLVRIPYWDFDKINRDYLLEKIIG